MHLSVLALGFLVIGIGTGWVTSFLMRFYRPAASTHQLLQAVARWLFVVAFGMGAVGFFLMGVVMLWYPADARGHVHTPDGSLGSAAQTAAGALIVFPFVLLFSWMVIDRWFLPPANPPRAADGSEHTPPPEEPSAT